MSQSPREEFIAATRAHQSTFGLDLAADVVEHLADHFRATLEWFRKQTPARQIKMRAGITPKREAEVLAAWHASKKK